ncbi:hypothetical protein FPOA_06667 [Fusarium poae]|uniref:Rhodanese domain-containing protein n=1 Tax=Fusarium poae TaxID=36050 RepID=A0A1B8AIA6_FUSPO|nr:hypothetical protein FPOA_06667 [Fusarium poae]
MAAPWHAAYPAPEHQPESLTREEVLKSMKEVSSVAKQDFVLIDLRRNDHEAAGLRKIIWYCSSSRGRGTRAAGWFSDYIANRGDSEMKSLVLLEGIKGWATAGGEFVEWMDEYEPAVWSVE